jgi:nitrogen fixation-related uncharacterized protein
MNGPLIPIVIFVALLIGVVFVWAMLFDSSER